MILYTLLTILAIANADTFTRHQKNLEFTNDVNDFVFKGNSSKVRGGNRIFNGMQASNTQFPFMAEMSINLQSGGLLCSGSLIGVNWILSARHCIAG
jgi:V8-like Glu-specific endopeptidase